MFLPFRQACSCTRSSSSHKLSSRRHFFTVIIVTYMDYLLHYLDITREVLKKKAPKIHLKWISSSYAKHSHLSLLLIILPWRAWTVWGVTWKCHHHITRKAASQHNHHHQAISLYIFFKSFMCRVTPDTDFPQAPYHYRILQHNVSFPLLANTFATYYATWLTHHDDFLSVHFVLNTTLLKTLFNSKVSICAAVSLCVVLWEIVPFKLNFFATSHHHSVATLNIAKRIWKKLLLELDSSGTRELLHRDRVT